MLELKMERLNQIFMEVLEADPGCLKDEWTMDEVRNWDSLKQMEIIAAIEKVYDFELTFEEIAQMSSIGNIKSIVKKRIS